MIHMTWGTGVAPISQYRPDPKIGNLISWETDRVMYYLTDIPYQSYRFGRHINLWSRPRIITSPLFFFYLSASNSALRIEYEEGMEATASLYLSASPLSRSRGFFSRSSPSSSSSLRSCCFHFLSLSFPLFAGSRHSIRRASPALPLSTVRCCGPVTARPSSEIRRAHGNLKPPDEKLRALRELFSRPGIGIDAYIIPSEDAHQVRFQSCFNFLQFSFQLGFVYFGLLTHGFRLFQIMGVWVCLFFFLAVLFALIRGLNWVSYYWWLQWSNGPLVGLN